MSWIRLSQKLPPDAVNVLCWQQGVGCVIAYWSHHYGLKDVTWINEEGDVLYTEKFPVTHWMFLPETPSVDSYNNGWEFLTDEEWKYHRVV